ncbi:hypothetical protein SETIT_5G223900v2 [Setaria italica]|uniref:Uncharacterized protein n=1 Tax=Setaria italica TaxID=4555 RepID=A0A368R7J9_SETIT|nr:hypothetical protein SETIT_5G223900v2 [Setaria italica]
MTRIAPFARSLPNPHRTAPTNPLPSLFLHAPVLPRLPVPSPESAPSDRDSCRGAASLSSSKLNPWAAKRIPAPSEFMPLASRPAPARGAAWRALGGCRGESGVLLAALAEPLRAAEQERAAIGVRFKAVWESSSSRSVTYHVHVPARCAIIRSSVIAVAGTTIGSGDNKSAHL